LKEVIGMLLRFRVANHRSIRSEQTLSLVAVPRRGEPKPRTSDIPRTVQVAGIYGTNASGKSNILDALKWMTSAIASSQTRWSPDDVVPRHPFKLDDTSRRAPSFYELDFIYDSIRYSYGFEVDDIAIQSEWLVSFPHGRPRQLLDRSAPRKHRFGRSLIGENARIARLTRPNSLFLSSAASNNHPLLSDIFHWVTHHVTFATHGEFDEQVRLEATKQLLENKLMAARIDRMLRIADLGLIGAKLGPRSVPESLVSILRDVLIRQSAKPEEIEAATTEFQRGILLRHSARNGMDVTFDLSEESAGTKVWLSLVGPLLNALDQGGVLIVDEIDSSLHPQLSSALIRMFKDPEINCREAQLVFASHDTTLLGSMIDDHLLDRDEVWFTEKNGSGATSLYALAEFHPRKDENVERGYLQGRYGAVPYLNFDQLREIFREEERKPDESTAQPPAPRPTG
jgi:uncharacterized protein